MPPSAERLTPQNAVLRGSSVAQTKVCATDLERQKSQPILVAELCCSNESIHNRFLQPGRTDKSTISRLTTNVPLLPKAAARAAYLGFLFH